jgi:hypothetical protein
MAIPIVCARHRAFRVCALHPVDEAEAIDARAEAPELLRATLIAADTTALALHEGAAPVFADGDELLRMFTEREATALMHAALDALAVISPSFRTIDEEAWERRLAEGAKMGSNVEQAIALAACVDGDLRHGIPRPERYFGLPAGQLTDGQRLVFRAARRAVFDEDIG